MDIKKYAFRKAAAEHLPVSGTFELTPRCNLSCEMCYIRMSKKEQSLIGHELTADEWLSLGREAVGGGMVYLLLTGGEPLLRPDFEEIYSGLSKMGILLTLNTNATLIDERFIECIEQDPPERVNVTLYGASEETYLKVCGNPDAYQAALRGIRLLKEAGIHICINTTYTKHNSADMEKIVSFARANDLPIRMTSYIFPPLRSAGERDESCFLEPDEYGRLGAEFDMLTMDDAQKKRRVEIIQRIRECRPTPADKGRAASCMAGRGAFWVTWDGKLLPCGMLPELGKNLKDESFQAVWSDFERVMVRQFIPVECTGCPKRILCPVCIAVTQSGKESPKALCRYCDSYMKRMTELQERSE